MLLPIEKILPELRQKLARQAIVVLEAPPGTGKTTRVPLALLDETWLIGQKILMLEPRRLAARGAAEFMARQLGEKVGQTVGYSIRYEHRISQHTRIEVITEGILTRRLQSDPELTGVGLVIFDEFHERNLHSDIALALTNDLRKGLREDLRILIMSATLESEPLIKLLQAEHLSCTGRNWPIDIIYTGGEISFNPIARMTTAIGRAVQETTGDILAFLPGIREIDLVEKQMLKTWGRLLICPLHGQLNSTLQRQALDKSPQRKLILATNIAETSLTIEGIETVVDSGLCRQPGFDPGSGLTRLKTTRISQASSLQRAGRAGRQGPGRCYRLWSENVQASLLPQTPPEIRNADLTPLALELGGWGLQDAAQLDWLDPPPAGALAAAERLLHQLGLKDQRGRLTRDGERAVQLPVHPRFASLLLQAERLKSLSAGCAISAFLSERAGMTGSKNIDFSDELHHFIQDLRAQKKAFHPQVRAFNQLAAIFTVAPPGSDQLNPELLAELIATAYPDRVAYSANANGDYLLSNNRGAILKHQSTLGSSPWLAITDINQNDREETQIRHALPLNAKWLAKQIAAAEWQDDVFWDNATQRVLARRTKKLGAIVLRSTNQTPSPEQTIQVLGETLRKNGEHLLSWSKEVAQFQQRVELLRKTFGPDWPNMTREQLLLNPQDWLNPFLNGIKTAVQLRKLNLLPALQNLLDWQQNQQINQLAPLRVTVPSGDSMKINYQPDAPVLPVKLQQLFGLAETPSICQGQVPLKLHLLSPAGRPLAVTSDLRSFWNQVYPEVQKEMKGRYPKHPWPDDPWLAVPTRKLKKFKK